MKTIHWWMVQGHWFSAIADVGESAEACLERMRKNITVLMISKPDEWLPFEWEIALRFAVHKPHLSHETKGE